MDIKELQPKVNANNPPGQVVIIVQQGAKFVPHTPGVVVQQRR